MEPVKNIVFIAREQKSGMLEQCLLRAYLWTIHPMSTYFPEKQRRSLTSMELQKTRTVRTMVPLDEEWIVNGTPISLLVEDELPVVSLGVTL